MTRNETAETAWAAAHEAAATALADGLGNDAAHTAAWDAARDATKASEHQAHLLATGETVENAFNDALYEWLRQ